MKAVYLKFSRLSAYCASVSVGVRMYEGEREKEAGIRDTVVNRLACGKQ